MSKPNTDGRSANLRYRPRRPHALDVAPNTGGGPPAFVFQLVPTAFQHGSLGIVRSLGRLGVSVHGNYARPGAPIRRSRFAAAGEVWRPWPRGPEEAVERLVAWGLAQRERAVLIPTDDAGAVAVANHEEELARCFVFPRQHQTVSNDLSNKLSLAGLCAEVGVPTPRTVAPTDTAAAMVAAKELGFPVVVKRIANRSQLDYKAPSVQIVDNPSELGALWRRLAARGTDGNHLLQEFIPGGAETIWMFNGYFDERSRCVVGYTGFKLRQYPAGRGPTTLGECRRNDVVLEQAERLFSGLGYRGIVDAGFRYDHRDGGYKLLDVNPRIGATFRLFVAPSGTDVVRALYLDLTGRPVPDDLPPDGRRWLVEPLDLRTSLASPRVMVRWPGSLRGVRELAWLAKDDPLPAAAMAAAAASETLRSGAASVRDAASSAIRVRALVRHGTRRRVVPTIRAAVPLGRRMQFAAFLSRHRVPKHARIAYALLRDWRRDEPTAYHRFLWSRHLAYAATYDARADYGRPTLHPLRHQILDATRALVAETGATPTEIRSVLDVGCSTGRILRYCETDVFPAAATLQGVDVDATAVAQGTQVLRTLGSSVELVVADLADLDAALGATSFDLVLCLGVLMYVDQETAGRAIRAMLERTRRMLVVKDIACPDVGNHTLSASRVREPDGGQIHNIDAMVARAGGRVVDRWWRGPERVDGLDVYVVFAVPGDGAAS